MVNKRYGRRFVFTSGNATAFVISFFESSRNQNGSKVGKQTGIQETIHRRKKADEETDADCVCCGDREMSLGTFRKRFCVSTDGYLRILNV